MYFLARPPYLRWLVAGSAVVLSLYADLRPSTTVPHPFALTEIAAGDEITTALIETRQVPVGLFAPVELPDRASRPVLPGEPITEAVLGGARLGIPLGWWAIELAVPPDATAGDGIRVVIAPEVPGGEAEVVSGQLVSPGIDDGVGEVMALVALPPESAPVVALAWADGRASVLLAP